MSIRVVAYTPEMEEQWDTWCASADNATILHTRRFLNYHGDRFIDQSRLIYDDAKLVGVLPAASAPGRTDIVTSHPGVTYGGLVHHGWLTGERMIEAMLLLAEDFRACGYSRFQYKPLPYIYARVPSQDDLYALFRIGATRVRCDLSSTIDLTYRRPTSDRRKRGLKKASRVVRVVAGIEYAEELWHVLEANLEKKHGAKPVHSIAELKFLAQQFPKDILIRAAILEEKVAAGVVLFRSATTWHAQYIASSEAGYSVSALDAVFESIIEEARLANCRYFDFGTSNEEAGTILNDGLYRFKSEFGGGGMVHEYYELKLQQ
ncbi:GNAT family N-acetyltransferase [Herbaspirillum huttiense]|uniref:GNAT family N-acetyltransferase n=1 Tax=Herbaspirillum huttiense TaxID=863372 RepID=UPI001066232E|nr:GNAT family N-acetyltransferase [Herbaspirillum huttiense]QBP73991.1 GNAT family N-acetyltransferase [Herbaspirillum huttiense]